MKQQIQVAAVALVDVEGNVLLAKRPKGKHLEDYWEFPGGKIEPGETPEHALIRELKEELAIDTQASCLAPFSFTSHHYDACHVLLLLYLCRKWQGMPQAIEAQAISWKHPREMAGMDITPAGKPLVAMLRDYL